VARPADALRVDLRETLEDLDRLLAAEQQVAGHVDVGDGRPRELPEHRLEGGEVAVDVREERHRGGRGARALVHAAGHSAHRWPALAITWVAPLRDGIPTPANGSRRRPTASPLCSSIATGLGCA